MDDLREVIAREAYKAHHRNGPFEDALDEPNMGRGGFKTEVCAWSAVADAALAAIKQAGFVVVPAEPTPRMLEAGRYAICGEPDTHADTTEASGDCYRAMIEASNG